MQQKEVNPLVFIGVIAVAILVALFFGIRAMMPHETIIDRPNAPVSAAERLRQYNERERAKGAAGHPIEPTSQRALQAQQRESWQ